MDRFKQWMEEVREKNLHKKVYILAGITPLKSARMAKYMKDNVSGVTFTNDIIERMENADDQKEEGKKIALEQIEEMKNIEGVHGVHLMAIGGEKSVPAIAEEAGLLPRPNTSKI